MTFGFNPYIDMVLGLFALCLIPHDYYRNNTTRFTAMIFLTLASVYTLIRGSIPGILSQFFIILIPLQMIALDTRRQLDLFHWLSKWLAILLALSTFWWILYLCGVNLPHTEQHLPWDRNSYGYRYLNYGLFILIQDMNPWVLPEPVPRFCSFFLEPGHVGTIMVFLLYANGFTMRRWVNVVYWIVIILTFSAAAYTLLVTGLVLYGIFRYDGSVRGVMGRIRVIFSALLMVGIFLLMTLNFNGGDNVINDIIIGKLTRDTGAINGRFSNEVNRLFDDMLQDGRLWFGLGAVELKYSAGYKVYMIMNGIVGTMLTLLAYFKILQTHFSRLGLGMLLLVVMSWLQRAYPFWDAFIDTYILGVTFLAVSQSARAGARKRTGTHAAHSQAPGNLQRRI